MKRTLAIIGCLTLAALVVSFALLVAALKIEVGREGSPQEVAEIKSNYVAFRGAISTSNFDRAKEFVSKGYLLIYSPEQVLRTYESSFHTSGALTDKAFIRFGPDDRAWLWPQAPPEIGSWGIGFIKQTNGWKLDGNFIKVMD